MISINAPYGLGLNTNIKQRKEEMCGQWIENDNGEQLTRHERTLKSLQKHVKINKQPRWMVYLRIFKFTTLEDRTKIQKRKN